MGIIFDKNRKYSLNNECVVSSLVDKEIIHENVLSDLMIPSYDLFKDRNDSISTDINTISDLVFIRDDGRGNHGLSGKVDFILGSIRDSMDYAGELNSVEYVAHGGKLTCFIAQGDDRSAGEFVKRGKFFRVNCNTPELSDSLGGKISLKVNDYFFTKNESILSDITIPNLAIIRDAQVEVEEIQKWVGDNFLHLSGGDHVQNTEYFNDISATTFKSEGLSVLNSDLENVEIENSNVQNENVKNLSVDSKNVLSIIHDNIEDRIETLSVETVVLSNYLVLSSLGEKDGKIEFGTRELLSSDVKHLTDYVQNEINLSLDVLDAEIGEDGKFILSVKQENGKIVGFQNSKVTNDFIEDNTISQSKISNLVTDLYNISSDLSTVIKRNENDLSYFGTVNANESETHLAKFIDDAMMHLCGHKFIKGFTFRIDKNCIGLPFAKNDYVIFNKKLDDYSIVELSDLDIIHDFNNEVTNLSDYIKSLDNEVILTSDSYISVLTKVTQTDGKISFETKELLSSDVNGLSNWVAELNSQLSSFKEYSNDTYFKKSGGLISGNVDIDGNLSVSGNISSPTIDVTKIDSDGDCTRVYANNNVDIYAVGACRKINLSTLNGLGDVVVNGTSVKKTIDDTVESLSVENHNFGSGKILSNIEEKNGRIILSERDILTSDIPTLPQSKINGLETDYVLTSNFKTSKIDNDKKFTIKDEFDFYRDVSLSNYLVLKVQDMKLSVDCSQFVKDGFLNNVSIVTVGDEQYLRFVWNTDSGKEPTDIKLKDFAVIYKGGHGITLNSDYSFSIDDHVVTQLSDFNPVKANVELLNDITDTLSSKIDIALSNDIRDLKFDGCVESFDSEDTIGEVIRKAGEIGTEESARNNSIYRVCVAGADLSAEFEPKHFGKKFSNTDFLLIHDHDASVNRIKWEFLNNNNVYVIKTGVSNVDLVRESSLRLSAVTDLSNYIWSLDNNITLTSSEPESISVLTKVTQTDGLVSFEAKELLSSDIFGLSDGVDGRIDAKINDLDNEGYILTGGTYISVLTKLDQTDGIIGAEARTLISSDISGLSDGIKGYIDALDSTVSASEGNFITSITQTDGKLTSVGGSKVTDSFIDNGSISQGKITGLGASLQSLSNQISCKIWIKNPTDSSLSAGAYSDLSVIKINKQDYELSVVARTLCESAIYIVSSDYIDAYGEPLCNLTMPGRDDGYEGVATTKTYVDEKDKEIDDKIEGLMLDMCNTLSNSFHITPESPTLSDRTEYELLCYCDAIYDMFVLLSSWYKSR